MSKRIASCSSGRSIELGATGDGVGDGKVVIRFPYHPTLVNVVRGLSRRNFDSLNKCWCAPVEVLVEVIDTLLPHDFAIGATAREAYAARGGTREIGAAIAEPPEPAAPMSAGCSVARVAPIVTSAPPDSWTVSALNARVQQVLRNAFPERLWIVGEIAGFERNRHRPHVWFELIEKEEESAGGGVRATVSAVLFAAARREIERKLAAADVPFELTDGLEVRVAVRVELYAPRGAFQLVVEEVDPVHTLGKLAQDRAKVLAELDRRGLRGRNAALPWPLVPLRVGLITSAGSDAYNDFVNELHRSGYAFAITVADTRVQGAGLEGGLTAALRWFTARAGDFDAVAIVRGGGAKTDLMGFDHLQVALAVATCPLKVIAGIGHQRDVSVVDLISHSEKTPTAAAAAIVLRVAEYEQRLVDGGARLREATLRRLPAEREWLRRMASELATGAAAAGRDAHERLAAARARLAPALQAGLRGERGRLDEARVRLDQLTRGQTRLRAQLLEQLVQRFAPGRFAAALMRRAARLRDLDLRAAALHPRATLRRGFAIVRDAAGRTVRDAAQLPAGARLAATFCHGRVEATVVRSEAEGGATSAAGTDGTDGTDRGKRDGA
ncbi:MAG: exodeoxyribonuclease VII large subunit [Planctomycetes bacterium]|nr:exodeoxyribonuclease VII large subunit [Planctomycetota bacterium]